MKEIKNIDGSPSAAFSILLSIIVSTVAAAAVIRRYEAFDFVHGLTR
jgi:hypothetical protein